MEGSSKKKTTRRRAENHAGKRPGRDLAMAKRGFEDVAAADTAGRRCGKGSQRRPALEAAFTCAFTALSLRQIS